eukprot:8798834-Pyramimonas_sp.AAC.1
MAFVQAPTARDMAQVRSCIWSVAPRQGLPALQLSLHRALLKALPKGKMSGITDAPMVVITRTHLHGLGGHSSTSSAAEDQYSQ